MKFKIILLMAAFGLMATATLTSCENVLGHWERPTGAAVTPSDSETPATPAEEVVYSFSLSNLAGDADVTATTLKVTDQTGTEIATAQSDGKYTIKADDLTSAEDLWLEATTATGKYIAKAKKADLAGISEEGKLKMATLGDVILADGNFYKAGTSSPVAMIAYVGSESNCDHGLAIQLNASPETRKWKEGDNYPAQAYAESLTAIPGGTWRLPSKKDWVNMLAGCANEGDATTPDNSNSMNPIKGFRAKIAATGIIWQSGLCWSSTPSDSKAWRVNVGLDGSSAFAEFSEYDTSTEYRVLGCLAF